MKNVHVRADEEGSPRNRDACQSRAATGADHNPPKPPKKRKKVMVVLTESQLLYLDGIAFHIRQQTGEKIDRSTILRQIVKKFIRADLSFETGEDLKRFKVIGDGID